MWFVDDEGHRWLDLESQVFNANLGHGETRVTDPDERLAARARAEGWSIVSFRAAEPPALV